MDRRPFHRGDLRCDVMHTCAHAEMWSQLNCVASKRDGVRSHSHDIVSFAAHSDLKHSSSQVYDEANHSCFFHAASFISIFYSAQVFNQSRLGLTLYFLTVFLWSWVARMQEIIVLTLFWEHQSVLLVFTTKEPVSQVLCFILVETLPRSKHTQNRWRQSYWSAINFQGITLQVKCILGCGVYRR